MTKRLFVVLAALVALFAVATPALAQDDLPPPDDGVVTQDEVNAIASELYCPVCDNIPLDVCGTQACADWRAEIETMLMAGATEEEVKTYFVDRYGQRVLANPGATGINTLLYIAPPLAVLAGAVVLVITLRRMAPKATAETIAPQAALNYDGLDPEYVARIEADLRELGARS